MRSPTTAVGGLYNERADALTSMLDRSRFGMRYTCLLRRLIGARLPNYYDLYYYYGKVAWCMWFFSPTSAYKGLFGEHSITLVSLVFVLRHARPLYPFWFNTG